MTDLLRQKAEGRLSALAAPAFAWPEPAPHTELNHEKETSTLVFVDGFFDAAASHAPSGVLCLPLDAALKSYGFFLQNRWTKIFKAENDPYFLLSALHHGKGAFLYVPPKVSCNLIVRHLSTRDGLASPFLQISLGKGASLTISQTRNSGFSNAAVDISLDVGAEANVYDMQLLTEESHSFTSLRASLKKDARLSVFHATEGAKKSRFSAEAELLEENSSFQFRTLGMLSGDRESEINALADHVAPSCRSHQHVKMVLNGNSRSHFEGKIYVHPTALKTEAYQLNNNLLLSDEAKATAKPNLEIFADDVKASHGATFSQISDEDLFYLRSRGVQEKEARALLTDGFCREVIDAFPEAMRAPLLKAMAHA